MSPLQTIAFLYDIIRYKTNVTSMNAYFVSNSKRKQKNIDFKPSDHLDDVTIHRFISR